MRACERGVAKNVLRAPAEGYEAGTVQAWLHFEECNPPFPLLDPHHQAVQVRTGT